MAYSSVLGINLNLANCRTVIVYLSTALLQVGLTGDDRKHLFHI